MANPSAHPSGDSTLNRTREVRREFRATPDPTGGVTREIRESSRHPLGDPHEAVSDLIERVSRAHGGAKSLAGGQISVSYPQIRKMAGDGSIPSLGQVLRFVELAGPDDPFRHALINHLRRLFDPPEINAREISQRVAERLEGQFVCGQTVGAVVREVIEEITPGRWGRTS